MVRDLFADDIDGIDISIEREIEAAQTMLQLLQMFDPHVWVWHRRCLVSRIVVRILLSYGQTHNPWHVIRSEQQTCPIRIALLASGLIISVYNSWLFSWEFHHPLSFTVIVTASIKSKRFAWYWTGWRILANGPTWPTDMVAINRHYQEFSNF